MTGDAGATSATEPGGASLRHAERADLDTAEQLLRVLELPTDGVADWIERFWVAEHAGTVVGVAGIERYGAAGLLR